jgi:hypothetical protein
MHKAVTEFMKLRAEILETFEVYNIKSFDLSFEYGKYDSSKFGCEITATVAIRGDYAGACVGGIDPIMVAHEVIRRLGFEIDQKNLAIAAPVQPPVNKYPDALDTEVEPAAPPPDDAIQF